MFTFERWAKHRSTTRYVKHLAHMFTSRVFKSLLVPMCGVMSVALGVGIYETLLKARQPEWGGVWGGAAGQGTRRARQQVRLWSRRRRAGAGAHPVPLSRAPPAHSPLHPHPPHTHARAHTQAGALPGHWPHVTLALGQAFNLTAFALSLLLVFRTNSSCAWRARGVEGVGMTRKCMCARARVQPQQQAARLAGERCLLACPPPARRRRRADDRWWEARKLWGGVVNRTRDFMRQVCTGWETRQRLCS